MVGVNLEKEKQLNSPERFEEAFKGIPREMWRVYEHCGEIESEIEKIKADRLAAAAASGDTSVGAAAPPPVAKDDVEAGDVTVKNGNV